MNEDNLDKISRLIHSITTKHGYDVTFSISTYFGKADLHYNLMFVHPMGHRKNYMATNSYDCIMELERIYEHGIITDKEDLLRSIDNLSTVLEQQKQLLTKLEEKFDVI